ncbi:hypothetical protein AMK34_01100 [Amycolatopsis sp. CB00013]|nr:hypothetical protein AMK34_01100 [Amycolatopsis sp. CB00013]
MFMFPPETEHVVARPELIEQVVKRLGVVESTSAVVISGIGGAGGFGKTTLAAQVCRDRRIRSRFEEVLWLTVGEDAAGTDLAAKINDLAAQLAPSRPTYVDPQQAGYFLSSLLRDRPRLLVLDDVWRAAQLAPFLFGEDRCVRLVTTRQPAILPADVDPVVVDQMTEAQAEELLLDCLPADAESASVGELLRRTGRWPVLLRITNGAIRRLLRTGASLDSALRWVVDQLAVRGPAAFDPGNADQRAAAVDATIDASLRLLAKLDERWLDRFLSLAVFPEDTPIPFSVLTVYWSRHGTLSADESLRLCLDLRDLSLVERFELGDSPEMRLHDVIRDYLRHRAGNAARDMHRDLVEAYRGTGAPWRELADEERYLAERLSTHLAEAGLEEELSSLACDPRWLAVVLRWLGPPAAESELAKSSASLAPVIGEAISQNAHLLASIEPRSAMLPLLLTRLGCDARLASLAGEQFAKLDYSHLMPSRPLPDAPDPANARTISVGKGAVQCLESSPTGDWFATAGRGSPQVRFWNANGSPRATFEMPDGASAFALSPDGHWLAAAGPFGRTSELRIWHTDGELIASVPTYARGLAWSSDSDWVVTSKLEVIDRAGQKTSIAPHAWSSGAAVAVNPASTMIAVVRDVAVWLFDRTGHPIVTFAGHTGGINALAFGAAGQWIATASDDGTVRITGLDGVCQTILSADGDPVRALAVAPDGHDLATVDNAGQLRLWTLEGELRATVDAHPKTRIDSVVFTRTGKHLITGDGRGTVRIWDVSAVSRQRRTTLAELTAVLAISPDGSRRIAVDDSDSAVLIDLATNGARRTIWPDGLHLDCVRISRDGRYMIGAGGKDDVGKVLVWNADSTEELELSGHTRPVLTAAISPDDTWFATGGMDGTLRFWDRSGSSRAVAHDQGWVMATAVSPGGDWLACAHDGGEIRIWEPDGTMRTQFADTEDGIARALVVPADGATVVSGHVRGALNVWTPEGQLITTLRGHSGTVLSLALSPDSRWLASAGHDGQLRIWDLRTHQCSAATRVDGHLRHVCWEPGRMDILASGTRGLYEFSFRSALQ